ncbi:PIN domain-containing protein [Aliivibrio fischeri]|uniref:PIN domain-containing protein n=1 Tax=Aliivibrio fischeri TaxID=668 RepID=UPI001F3DF206|nr:PIN domain-containing protein [Aliivibrio fischeri]MCE7556435.1 PIN domain-containing protein [Aliivibrio fischeri]MCE7563000.1 PIN domain-containing protein [Aliivibrio fischeri]MCE7571292.1 PIN domain-containing protein [Aliivibrio fischeri]
MDGIKIDLEYDAIVIDTSIFDGNGLKLESGMLGKLKQFKDGPIDFIMPDIVKNEIQSHLEKKIKVSRNALEKSINDAGDHLFFDGSALNDAKQLLINSNEIENLAKSRLDNFIESSGAWILDSNDFVSVGELVNKYFLNEPPFSETGKKKNEFPDAIALMALEKWAENEGKTILAIAKDGDWKSFCESSDYIDYQDDLAEGLAIFNQANAPFALKKNLFEAILTNQALGFLSKIESYLDNELDDLTPDQDAESAFYWEPEGTSTSFKSYTLDSDFKIIDVDEEWIVLEAKASIIIDAEGQFSLSVHDSIDRDYVSLGGVIAHTEVEFETELLITISGQLDGDVNDLEIEQVEVMDTPSCIDYGSIEPDFY